MLGGGGERMAGASEALPSAALILQEIRSVVGSASSALGCSKAITLQKSHRPHEGADGGSTSSNSPPVGYLQVMSDFAWDTTTSASVGPFGTLTVRWMAFTLISALFLAGWVFCCSLITSVTT